MSEARRRKRAVCLRAGRGVVDFWVETKVVSQVGEGWRDFVVVMWVDSWVRMVEGWDAMVVRQIMTFGDDDSSVCDGCVVLRRSRCRHGK